MENIDGIEKFNERKRCGLTNPISFLFFIFQFSIIFIEPSKIDRWTVVLPVCGNAAIFPIQALNLKSKLRELKTVNAVWRSKLEIFSKLIFFKWNSYQLIRNSTLCNKRDLSVSVIREMFSGRVLIILPEPLTWSRPNQTRYFFLYPLWFRYFSYLWVGPTISFFKAADPREKADLQAVALMYKYWERN